MRTPGRRRTGHGLQSRFVGRARELGWLEEMVASTRADARPRLARVVGEAGMGKTSLVRELRGRLPAATAFRLGRCLSYGRSVTYSALADVLRAEVGLQGDDPAEDVLARLGGHEILGLTLGLDVAGDLEPQAALVRLQDAWVQLVSRLAAAGPAVLVIEDMHWATGPLLEVIERVLADAEGPILLLATARPDEAPFPAAETLRLERLGDQEVTELIEAALAGPLEPRGREVVIRHADGNPFFAEEVLADLIDRGLLERNDGGWVLGDAAADPGVPDSVRGLLAARIDLLPAPAKDALQAASVIGRSFTPAGLAALTGSSAEVRTLVERGFVRPAQPRVVFKHALTREVAYNGLTKARRARLHADFARWLDGMGGGRDDHAPLLAHHYAEAVRPDDVDVAWPDGGDELDALRAKAVAWLSRAGDLAVGRYEIDDGVALLERAVALEPDEARQAELWRGIGLANAIKFDGEAFWRGMQRSIAVTSDRELRAETYGDLALQTAIRMGMWLQRPPSELVQGWIEEALRLAPPGSPARAKGLLADGFWNRVFGEEAAAEATSIAERLGDVELLEYSFGAHSFYAFGDREFAKALAWTERSLELVDEIEDPDHLADLYENAISAFCGVGRFDEARSLVDRHVALAEGLTPHRRLHGIALRLEVDEICGTWDDVIAVSDRTAALVEQNLSTPCVRNARSLLVTALAAALTGDPEAAAALEASTREVVIEGYDHVLGAPRARLALVRGDTDAALGFAPQFDDFRIHWVLANAAARLDALVAAGTREEELERHAPAYAHPGSYTEPFALRALGIVRADGTLLRKAEERFAVLGLRWHSDQTPVLMKLRQSAA